MKCSIVSSSLSGGHPSTILRDLLFRPNCSGCQSSKICFGFLDTLVSFLLMVVLDGLGAGTAGVFVAGCGGEFSAGVNIIFTPFANNFMAR